MIGADLESLHKSALVALVMELMERLDRLEGENEALRAQARDLEARLSEAPKTPK